MWDVPGASCLSVCPEGSSPCCLDWGETKCGDGSSPPQAQQDEARGQTQNFTLASWLRPQDRQRSHDASENLRMLPLGTRRELSSMHPNEKVFFKNRKISLFWRRTNLLRLYVKRLKWIPSGYLLHQPQMFWESTRLSEWFCPSPLSWKSPLNRLLSDVTSNPPCVFRKWWDFLGGKKKNLQGTFVTGRMCYRKTPVHKSRTERINAGPPWKLRMSYSLRFPWLWASKSVAAKWLHLGFSFQCRVEFWGFTALKHLSPFDSMLNTKAQVIRPLMGRFLILAW